ncbi:MAG: VWA domain-containing protein [Gemmatimonadota bacterium]|nr:VWA domain-containing protein [Gemmatimonadota bacterium]
MGPPGVSEPLARLAANVVHFGRLLRAAGLPVGSGQILDAVRAASSVDVRDRREFFWGLHAALVTDRSHRFVFQQAFDGFWKDPFGQEQAMSQLLPRSRAEGAQRGPVGHRRIAEAWGAESRRAQPREASPEEVAEFDAVMTWSSHDALRTRDFEQMSSEEMARARSLIKRMVVPRDTVATRRHGPKPTGPRIDMRRTLRAALREGGQAIPLRRSAFRRRPTPWVALCDVSGSMDRYARIVLHFLHAVSAGRRVESFLFGTRLWHVTRQLRHRDVDAALEDVGSTVSDWSGGTRIGASLEAFNRHWSRRVLAQGATVLLITDGLDRDDASRLAVQMERLHRSCRRLVWLNPLLRFEGFEPRATGVKTILPHVDEHRPVHNLASLEALITALTGHRAKSSAGAQLAAEHAADPAHQPAPEHRE